VSDLVGEKVNTLPKKEIKVSTLPRKEIKSNTLPKKEIGDVAMVQSSSVRSLHRRCAPRGAQCKAATAHELDHRHVTDFLFGKGADFYFLFGKGV